MIGLMQVSAESLRDGWSVVEGPAAYETAASPCTGRHRPLRLQPPAVPERHAHAPQKAHFKSYPESTAPVPHRSLRLLCLHPPGEQQS